MIDADRRQMLLAGAAGYEVAASDGRLGVVETPLFPPDAAEPDFLLLRVGTWPRIRRPVVSVSLVEAIDTHERIVRIRGRRVEIASLSERLPIAT
jgi:hypothetical protein